MQAWSQSVPGDAPASNIGLMQCQFLSFLSIWMCDTRKSTNGGSQHTGKATGYSSGPGAAATLERQAEEVLCAM